MKYAVVAHGGKQYLAQEGQIIEVDRLALEAGRGIEFKEVLLLSSEGKIEVGQPYIQGATVKGKIEAHIRGPKIMVFKYKPKQRYRRKRGHRQDYTRVAIQSIGLPAEKGPRKPAAKPKAVTKAPPEAKEKAKPTSKAKAPTKAKAKTLAKAKAKTPAKSKARAAGAPSGGKAKAAAKSKAKAGSKSQTRAKPKKGASAARKTGQTKKPTGRRSGKSGKK